MARITKLLTRVTKDDVRTIAEAESKDNLYKVLVDHDKELVVSFRLGDRKVRLMQTHDIDLEVSATYSGTHRARTCEKRALELVPKSRMPIDVQQYLMAMALKQTTLPDLSAHKQDKYFWSLRSSAQMRYWLEMSTMEREDIHRVAAEEHPGLATELALVRSNWKSTWKNDQGDKDYFQQYVTDESCAKNVLQSIDENIFIVTDMNRNIIFASFKKLCQAMFDEATAELLNRAYDMWSFFVPMPLPETKRHVIDRWIRKMHPELDPEKSTVESLPQAKMAVAHYGCWSRLGDPHGKLIGRTQDSLPLGQVLRWVKKFQTHCYMPMFNEAVLGKVTEMIRFLLEPLDPSLYQDYCDVWNNMPERARIVTSKRDFLTLFAIGINAYTQRHKDTHLSERPSWSLHFWRVRR
jgi:hypothetical protein